MVLGMKKIFFSKLYVILVMINVACLIASNIVTSKPVSFMSFVFTAGDLMFPISYILNDAIVEVYGYEKSRFSIRLSFFVNLLVVIFFMIAIYLPYPDYYISQESFKIVLSTTPRLLIASLSAYYFGNLVNSFIMDKMKRNDENKLWKRTIVSSIFGELIDSIIFLAIAFVGTISLNNLLIMIVSVYLLKILIEILFTPILIKIISLLKKMEGSL